MITSVSASSVPGRRMNTLFIVQTLPLSMKPPSVHAPSPEACL